MKDEKLTNAGAIFIVELMKHPEDERGLLAYALIETYATNAGKTAREVMKELNTLHAFFESRKEKEV